jgi:hypothetical protein
MRVQVPLRAPKIKGLHRCKPFSFSENDSGARMVPVNSGDTIGRKPRYSTTVAVCTWSTASARVAAFAAALVFGCSHSIVQRYPFGPM